MAVDGGRWRQITPSQFQWEAEALEFVRARLSNNDPNQAWANFEFVSGGSLNEVDLLVTTRKGIFLIEIKSHPGRISGDQSLWTWHRPDGSKGTFDNPIFLANTKAKRLKSLLERSWPRDKRLGPIPFIKALVFLSAPDVVVDLSADLAAHVVVRDAEAPQPGIDPAAPASGGGPNRRFPGLFEAISRFGAAEAADQRFRQLSTPQADAFVEAMAKSGIKESTRSRRIGSYLLQLPALAERGATQDFLAKHEQHGTQRRIRVFSNVLGMSPDLATALRDAATREFLAAERLQLPGIVRALDQLDTDFGPAVVYDHQPDAVRLDRFLSEQGDDLDAVDRLRIVKRIAEILHQVHGRRVTHRMLTPQSVWLRPARSDELEADPDLRWVPEISDLSMAAREHASSSGTTAATATRFGRLPSAAAGDIDVVLADPAAESYLAPEAYSDPDPDGQALDVFSVGAIAYLLCAGRPPATNRLDMPAALGSEGLRLDAVVPDAEPLLTDIIREATCPVVSKRFARMADLVAGLELCVEAVAPAEPSTTQDHDTDSHSGPDPLTAVKGDVLAKRFRVKERLGQGSTALALLCADQDVGRDVVLKVPLTAAADERMRREAEALDGLRHPQLVELLGTVELAGRIVLILAFAGRESLSVSLRRHGPASPEFLERWGTDLLEAVRYLEREGRVHRDIKPDNLGIVAQGKNDERHLVLFDFSLAGTPASDLTAGTPGYLEPFIEQRGAWDPWAERYAAAVTLYEMATGEQPRWGDGRTNPMYTEGEAQLATEVFDPDLTAGLTAFFARALRRDPTQRFDTAEDMLRAWQRVFEHEAASETSTIGDEPPGPKAGGPGEDDSSAAAGGEPGSESPGPKVALPANLALDDPVTSLAPKGKLRSGLRRFDLAQVRDLTTLEPAAVNRTRGVSPRTRRDILRLRAAVLDRFADELATAPLTSLPAPAVTNADRSVDERDKEPADDRRTVVAAPLLDIDALVVRLIPPRGKRGPEGAVADTVRALVGLTPIDGNADDWPTNQAVGDQVGLSSAAVNRNLHKARDHWRASAEVLAVTDDVVAVLADLGGVAAVAELTEPILAERGSGADPDDARRRAAAVVRAVIEADGGQRLVTRRHGGRVLVALDGPVGVDGSPVTFEAALALDLARRAGDHADRATADAVLVPSADAVADLRALQPSATTPLSDGRLVRLAAACSQAAVANPASDLVPARPDPVAVLRWSRPALMSAQALTVDGLRSRVLARFPTVDLPDRPALDALVDAAGLPLRYDDGRSAYLVAGNEPGALTTFTRYPSRQETVADLAPIVDLSAVAADEVSPEVEYALDVEAHLDRSLRDGGFVALRLPTGALPSGRAELARFQGPPHGMATIDLEARFLHHLKRFAEQRRVQWDRLVEADEPGSTNTTRLRAVTGPAVDAVIDEVTAAGTKVIAWFPGALVRYQGTSGMGAIDRLRDAAVSRTGRLETLWLVVLGSTVTTKPTIDGVPVPVIGPAEWVDLTDAWLQNLHRAGGRTA